MGLVQKDALRTMVISYFGIILGYLNKGLLFLIILSPSQIGLVNLILTVGLLFSQFANLGTSYTTWRFLPFFKNEKNNHHGFLTFILNIVLLGVVLTTFLYIAFSTQIQEQYIQRSNEFIEYYYWVIPIGIGTVFFMTLESYLRGFYKNIVPVFINDVVLRGLLTILLILLWMKSISFHHFVIAHSIIYMLPMFILVFYLMYLKKFHVSWNSIAISKRFQKIILDFSFYNYLNYLGVSLVNSLDIIMIAWFVGLDGTGVYATILFLTSAIQVPYRAIIRISGPLIADYWKSRDMIKMKALYTDVSSVSLILGLSAFCVLWMNIDLLFSFLKPEFQDGIWVFFFLMLGKMLDMFFGLNGMIFSTSKKYKYDLVFTILLIGIVYALNLLLIPSLGIIGAAISTGIALVCYNIGRVIFVWKIFHIHPFTKNQFIIIGFALLTLFLGQGAVMLIDNLWLRLVIELVLFILTFILPIFAFKLDNQTISFANNGWNFVRQKLKI